MKIPEILTLIFVFSLIGMVVAGWFKKRRTEVKTDMIGIRMGMKY